MQRSALLGYPAALLWALLPFAAAAFQVQEHHAQPQPELQRSAGHPVLVPELSKTFEIPAAAGERVGGEAGVSWHLNSFLGGLAAGTIGTTIFFGALLGVSAVATTSEQPELESGADAKAAEAEASAGSAPAGAAAKGLQKRRLTAPPWSVSKQQGQEEFSDEPCAESLHLFWPRTGFLVGMLMVQSISSIILSGFTDLIEKHVSLVYFMTMLVGLGGNAGGQSVVLAVRRLVIGQAVSVREQLFKGMLMSLVIMPLAMLRAYISHASFPMILTIGLSSGLIVVVACTAGTTVPIVLWALKVDPAHAASIIQVLMDITGIMIVCTVGVTMVALIGNG